MEFGCTLGWDHKKMMLFGWFLNDKYPVNLTDLKLCGWVCRLNRANVNVLIHIIPMLGTKTRNVLFPHGKKPNTRVCPAWERVNESDGVKKKRERESENIERERRTWAQTLHILTTRKPLHTFTPDSRPNWESNNKR